jgi:hypothetical protein
MADKLTFDHLCIKSEEVNFVIYHGGCTDGFASAFACWKKYPNKQIKFHPGKFDETPPDVTGKCVLLCDFSYDLNTTKTLISQAKKLIILDHHVSAENKLKDIPKENKLFCMNHSGAYITWSYFFGEETVPKFILYVEDNDIWTKKLPYTQEATAYNYSTPFEFSEYDKLLELYQTNFDKLVQDAAGMEKQNQFTLKKNIKYIAPKFIELNKKYYFVGHFNSVQLKSEFGNKAFDEQRHLDFSAIYSINDLTNTTTFSLRSTDDRTDVSKIALSFGGGGHRNAAGMTVCYATNTLPGIVYDNGGLYDLLDKVYVQEVPIDEDVSLELAVVNATQCQSELAKYLVQEENKTQNAVKILQKIHNNKENYKCEGALIWSYDGHKDISKYTLVLSDSLDIKKKHLVLELLEKESEFKYDDHVITFIQSGLDL